MKTLTHALIFSALFFSSVVHAQGTYVAVGEAKTKKAVLAILPSDPGIEKTIESDLNFVELFTLLPSAGLPQQQIASTADVKTESWSKTGADFLGFSTFKLEGGKVVYEFHLVTVGSNKEILAKRYNSDPTETKILAHTVANDIVYAITGKQGIFLTKIAMVCDKTGKKEVYTMNFDGTDAKQITRIRSLTLSPAWSPDGKRIAFSVYNRHSDNTKNLDLFEYSFSTGALKILSNRKGINSGATYDRVANRIALTMSYGGNPEIHFLDLDSRASTQITHSIGFDVDPNFSPDGSKLAFVSSRAGKPMVYVLDTANPGSPKRLTYAGQYNAAPNWAQDGKKLVFAGDMGSHFDLFTITSDGGKIDRLTKDEGNNEDPYYSPDGSMITFSTNRYGGKNIAVMSVDGTHVKRLTFGMGNCVAPKWSPYLK